MPDFSHRVSGRRKCTRMRVAGLTLLGLLAVLLLSETAPILGRQGSERKAHPSRRLAQVPGSDKACIGEGVWGKPAGRPRPRLP